MAKSDARGFETGWKCVRVQGGQGMNAGLQIGLLLRKRDVMALGQVSERKYKTLVETGALRALPQMGERRKRLFAASEVAKVVEVVG